MWLDGGSAQTTTTGEGASELGVGCGAVTTHVFNKRRTPALVPPGLFCDTLEADQEFALEVEELVQVREQVMDRVLVNIGRERLCISL
jgi:hypothetical protein